MDDTSIEVYSHEKGKRTLFFQDKTGAIRQIIYSNVTGSWKSPQDSQLQLTFVARNNTPLVVGYISEVSTLSLSRTPNPLKLHQGLTSL